MVTGNSPLALLVVSMNRNMKATEGIIGKIATSQ